MNIQPCRNQEVQFRGPRYHKDIFQNQGTNHKNSTVERMYRQYHDIGTNNISTKSATKPTILKVIARWFSSSGVKTLQAPDLICTILRYGAANEQQGWLAIFPLTGLHLDIIQFLLRRTRWQEQPSFRYEVQKLVTLGSSSKHPHWGWPQSVACIPSGWCVINYELLNLVLLKSLTRYFVWA